MPSYSCTDPVTILDCFIDVIVWPYDVLVSLSVTNGVVYLYSNSLLILYRAPVSSPFFLDIISIMISLRYWLSCCLSFCGDYIVKLGGFLGCCWVVMVVFLFGVWWCFVGVNCEQICYLFIMFLTPIVIFLFTIRFYRGFSLYLLLPWEIYTIRSKNLFAPISFELFLLYGWIYSHGQKKVTPPKIVIFFE